MTALPVLQVQRKQQEEADDRQDCETIGELLSKRTLDMRFG